MSSNATYGHMDRCIEHSFSDDRVPDAVTTATATAITTTNDPRCCCAQTAILNRNLAENGLERALNEHSRRTT